MTNVGPDEVIWCDDDVIPEETCVWSTATDYNPLNCPESFCGGGFLADVRVDLFVSHFGGVLLEVVLLHCEFSSYPLELTAVVRYLAPVAGWDGVSPLTLTLEAVLYGPPHGTGWPATVTITPI